MGQAGCKACKGGNEIAKDKLRAFIELAREAYELAALPPAIDYAKHIDPTYRDDLSRRSRHFLLRFSLDAKQAVEDTLNSIPKQRAEVLQNWLIDGSKYSEYQLTHKKLFFLKIDRLALQRRLRKGIHEK